MIEHCAARADGFQPQAWRDVLAFLNHFAVGDEHAQGGVLGVGGTADVDGWQLGAGFGAEVCKAGHGGRWCH